MSISVLLPSRKRPQHLKESIDSLIDNHSSPTPTQLEIFLAVDSDDAETLAIVPTLNSDIVKTMVFQNHYGYDQLHRYLNTLLSLSVCEWLMLWHDDALMETPNWDVEVNWYSANLVVLNPQTSELSQGQGVCVFPVVPHYACEAVSHFSGSPFVGQWWEGVGIKSGLLTPVPIMINHNQLDDDTALDRDDNILDLTSPEFEEGIKTDSELLVKFRDDAIEEVKRLRKEFPETFIAEGKSLLDRATTSQNVSDINFYMFVLRMLATFDVAIS